MPVGSTGYLVPRETQLYWLQEHRDKLKALWQMGIGDHGVSAQAPAHTAVLCDPFTVYSDNISILDDLLIRLKADR